jgi:hypothetical protein
MSHDENDELHLAKLDEDDTRILKADLPKVWEAANLLRREGLITSKKVERIRAKVHEDCQFWLDDGGQDPQVVEQLRNLHAATRAR